MPGGGPDREPEIRLAAAPDAPVPESPADEIPQKPGHGRLLIICFSIFAFEIGLFLVIFPWMDAWNTNYLQDLAPSLQQLWNEPYFRGGLTGLGFVNIYIAWRQTLGLLRRV